MQNCALVLACLVALGAVDSVPQYSGRPRRPPGPREPVRGVIPGIGTGVGVVGGQVPFGSGVPPPAGISISPIAPGGGVAPIAPGGGVVPIAPGAGGVPIAPGAGGVPIAPGAGGVPIAPGAGGVPLPGGGCQKYCKNPFTNNYDCCDHIRPGQCPPVRPECPVGRVHNPNQCFVDTDCFGQQEKCCPDICLGHNTCKPIQTTFG